jgi:hypothetical protein
LPFVLSCTTVIVWAVRRLLKRRRGFVSLRVGCARLADDSRAREDEQTRRRSILARLLRRIIVELCTLALEMATPPPSSWLRRFLLPTLIVAGGTAIGFWIQSKQIDQYRMNQIRMINAQLDADELAEKRARQDLHTPRGMPPLNDDAAKKK